jgi:CubicO group peptidase (beta-lactamase class C family)
MLSRASWRWLLCGFFVLLIGTAIFVTLGRSGQHGALVEATWAEPSMPETPAGKQIAGYLEAFNSGDEEALSNFVRRHFTAIGPGGSSLDDRVRSQQRLYKSSRGLNVFQAEERDGGQLEVLAQFRLTEEWRQMTFMVENVPPHRIAGVRIVPADAPAIPNQVAQRPLKAALEEYLTRLVNADEFSGVVAIARQGDTVFAKAYGLADQERNVPNTVDTPFHYASVGKMFTAVAVGQLAEADKLSFDDTLERHLPEYPEAVARQVTLDHLLTHRSGILDYFAALEQFEKVRGAADPQRDYLSVFANEPLRFKPGERFEYSNSNYILLGAVVEHISGQSFEEYLDEHIFSPAGMTATTLDPASRSGVNPAIGYTELGPDGKMTPGNRRANKAHAIGRGGAAGGGVTTADDLLRFAEALRAHRMLSPAMTAELVSEQVDSPRPGERYARGFICRDSRQGCIVGHSGGFPGVDAQVDIYANGWSVVVLANYEGVGEPVARHIEKLLAAERAK